MKGQALTLVACDAIIERPKHFYTGCALMASFRQIVVLFALALVSVGNLPLVVHHLTCHHSHCQAVELETTCTCSNHCRPVHHDAKSQALIEESHADDCVICFQLSQVGQRATEFGHECSLPLGLPIVDRPDSRHLPAVDCPHPPRGPPAA